MYGTETIENHPTNFTPTNWNYFLANLIISIHSSVKIQANLFYVISKSFDFCASSVQLTDMVILSYKRICFAGYSYQSFKNLYTHIYIHTYVYGNIRIYTFTYIYAHASVTDQSIPICIVQHKGRTCGIYFLSHSTWYSLYYPVTFTMLKM